MIRTAIAFLILFLLSFSSAYAEGISIGKVTHIEVPTYSPIILFGLDGNIAEKPLCNRDRQFAINLATPGGDAAYRALLIAKTNGFEIEVEGLNTCSAHSRSEDVKSIRIR